jgi:hypothetical protein
MSTFQVDWISDKADVSGQYCLMLTPVGIQPAFTRIPGATKTSWQLWLSAQKAEEYSQLFNQAIRRSRPTADGPGQLYKLFVTADFDVRPVMRVPFGVQWNRLIFRSKAAKEIRPVSPITWSTGFQDDPGFSDDYFA